MVIQPLIGNPYNGYINPYYWVDDHPLLYYGNNGSLDPSTSRNDHEKNQGASHLDVVEAISPKIFPTVLTVRGGPASSILLLVYLFSNIEVENGSLQDNRHQEFQVPKMEGFLYLIRLFLGWGSPYISLTYSLHIGEYLHFRYLKCLVKSFSLQSWCY